MIIVLFLLASCGSNEKPESDYNGAARPNPTGSKVDMGAVESSLPMPTPSITSIQKAVIGGRKANKINFSIQRENLF